MDHPVPALFVTGEWSPPRNPSCMLPKSRFRAPLADLPPALPAMFLTGRTSGAIGQAVVWAEYPAPAPSDNVGPDHGRIEVRMIEEVLGPRKVRAFAPAPRYPAMTPPGRGM